MKHTLLAALLLSGCATVSAPKDAAQTVYASEAAYVAAANAEASYAHDPGAQPAVIARMKVLDAQAYGDLAAARSAFQSGQLTNDQLQMLASVIGALSAYELANGVH